MREWEGVGSLTSVALVPATTLAHLLCLHLHLSCAIYNGALQWKNKLGTPGCACALALICLG